MVTEMGHAASGLTRGKRSDVYAHFASSIAAARPMPLAAPVMTATLPAWMTGWTSLSTADKPPKRLREGVVPRIGRRGDGPRSKDIMMVKISMIALLSTPIAIIETVTRCPGGYHRDPGSILAYTTHVLHTHSLLAERKRKTYPTVLYITLPLTHLLQASRCPSSSERPRTSSTSCVVLQALLHP